MVSNTTADDRAQTANKLDADFDEYEAEIRESNEVMYEDGEIVALVNASLTTLPEMADVLNIEYKVAQDIMNDRIDAHSHTLEQHTDTDIINLGELRANTQILVFEK